jgi:hypothetical protein
MTTPPASTRSRWPLWAAGGCVLLLACAVVAGAAAGLLVLRNRGAAQAGPPNVEYVLDASPRMLQASEGSTRLSVAEGVLAEIVRPASPAVAAGLRVFGTGQLSGACQDTNLLVPLAAANQEKISVQLTALQGGAGVDSALGVAMVSAIRDLAATRGPHSLVVVTGGADSCNAQADQLIAQEAKRQGIQLQIFVVGYQVSSADSAALQGVVDQTTDAKYIEAHNAADLRRSLEAIQAYVDAPGALTVANVMATAGASTTAGTSPIATVSSGTAPAGPTSTALNTGVLQFKVLSYAGQPAEAGGRLVVQAFSPQDHQTVLVIDYNNPASLRLPAGRYDVFLSYLVISPNSFIGGYIEQWVTGLSVQAGLTTTHSYDLKLGQVTVSVLEAAGKPVADGNYSFAFRLYHPDNLNAIMASVIVTNTATLQLAPGTYQVQVDFPDTNLIRQVQSANTFEVKAGQSLDYVVNLKLGHMRVEVDDALGQAIGAARLNANAYPTGNPDTPFAFSYSANPADLALQAGTSYNLVLTLDTGQKLTLTNQQVREGEVQPIKVNIRDFK